MAGRVRVIPRRWALAACLLAALGGPAWADLQGGLTAYRRRDYATALKEWLPVAQAGDATAQFYLGLMYERGRGVPPDPAEALRWYERAVKAFPEGEERKRAIAGRDRVSRVLALAAVDPSLVGRWQAGGPDPATGGTVERQWEIGVAGEFSMTVSRKGKDGALLGRSLEKGQFRAKDGQWSYTLPNQTFEGTYRIVGPDLLETTGPLGTARWTRAGRR